MKTQKLFLIVSTLALAAGVHAQPGRMNGPSFGGGMAKLFGDNQAFSADLEIQAQGPNGQNMTLPGKIAFDSGKSRFEMNLGDAKGGQMPPQAAAQMKTMGMDKMVTISRPDTKTTYMVYPGLSAYAPAPMRDTDADKPASAFKIETTELGKETVDGHPSVKNKVVLTDDEGKSREFTVWNATDLNKFPVKIELTEQGRPTTLLFHNVKASRPDSALFDPPADYTKYDSPQALMQQEMMKRMRNMPPSQP